MKKTTYILSILAIILAFSACKDETRYPNERYSDLQKKEEKTIKEYIARNNIQIVEEIPETWGTNTYYKTPSGLYFHLVEKGDENVSLSTSNKSIVYIWTIEHELDEQKTILSKKWEPADTFDGQPTKIRYGDSYYNTVYGSGLYEAIGLMKNKNSIAKIIVPSFLNTDKYGDISKAVGYELKITVIE